MRRSAVSLMPLVLALASCQPPATTGPPTTLAPTTAETLAPIPTLTSPPKGLRLTCHLIQVDAGSI